LARDRMLHVWVEDYLYMCRDRFRVSHAFRSKLQHKS
jgi:hypothetical protein